MRGSVAKRGNTWSYVVDIGRDPVSGRRRARRTRSDRPRHLRRSTRTHGAPTRLNTRQLRPFPFSSRYLDHRVTGTDLNDAKRPLSHTLRHDARLAENQPFKIVHRLARSAKRTERTSKAAGNVANRGVAERARAPDSRRAR